MKRLERIVKALRTTSDVHSFEDFMEVPYYYFNFMGVIIWPKASYRDNKWQILNFVLNIFCLNLAILCQILYAVPLVKASTNIVEEIDAMLNIVYCILSEINILGVFKNLKRINRIVHALHDMFPTGQDQISTESRKKFYRQTRLFTNTNKFVIWLNVLACVALVFYSKLYNFAHPTEDLRSRQTEPLLLWYPIKINTPLRVIAAIVQQAHVILIAGFGFLAFDTLLFCTVLQICMHLHIVSVKLDSLAKGRAKDLSNLVRLHFSALNLVDEINKVFSKLVFVTFVSSWFGLCFLGFQIMNGTKGVDFVKFVTLVVYATLKIFQVSLLGNMLLEASLNVGESAYNTNWYENSVQYQKVIQIIICRSQKPANLNAITFHEVCLISFKEVMSKSYTFFTLLHTMYNT